MPSGAAVAEPGAKKKTFRPDIQGLRMIAVLAVIADHLFHWPSGGFVGVDIFFVISGFLITSLLLREHEKTETISFWGFYRRRIKRIIPAAMIVIVATMIAAWILFSTARFDQTFWDGVWATFFMANWHFAIAGTDYFNADATVSPLQHYWSLSVEEQFYFVWPWLMLLIFWIAARRGAVSPRTTRVVAGAAMGIIVILSFAWAMIETQTSPSVAYFSTLTRAWELGLGALLAISAGQLTRIPDVLRPLVAWIGLIGIGASVFFIDDTMPFPGPWALLPVASTVLVIAAGCGGEQRFLWPLTNGASRWVGDISYSLYLWHFPVVIFGAVLVPAQTPLYFVCAIFAMMGLSIASYYFIEEPIRKSNLFAPRMGRRHRPPLFNDYVPPPRYAGLAVLLLLVVPLGVASWARDNMAPASTRTNSYVPPGDAGNAENTVLTAVDELRASLVETSQAREWPTLTPSITDAKANAELTSETGCLNPASLDDSICFFGTGPETAVIVGDSVAMAWMPAFRGVLEPLGYRVKGIAYSTCPFSTVPVDLDMGKAASDRCNNSRGPVIETINRLNPSVVVLIDSEFSFVQTTGLGDNAQAKWADHRIAAVEQIMDPSRRIVVVQQNPMGASPDSCYSPVTGPSACIAPMEGMFGGKTAGDKIAATKLGIEYFETKSWFAVSENVMPYAEDVPQRWDSAHLTAEYAALLVDPLRETVFKPAE